jgi:predicted nucleic acid-binding protein
LIYLIDKNVLQAICSRGNNTVKAWLATVDDHHLRLSAITIVEWQKGITKAARSNPESARRGQVELDAVIAGWKTQIAPIGAPEAKLWGQLLGAKEKNKDDIGLVATAKLHGWTLVTRNIGHCAGYGVRLLDPFRTPPHVLEPADQASTLSGYSAP